MNALDNIERTLEEWGQNLRGNTQTGHGMQPRDVLRAVLHSLEQNRVEGLDHKLYAPNNYRIEMRLDPEETARLLPFTSEDELRNAIERYCRERKYQFRGPLTVQVMTTQSLPTNTGVNSATVKPGQAAPYADKVIVHSGFEGAQPAGDSSAYTAATSQFDVPVDYSRSASDHDLEGRNLPPLAGRR
jgi:hypothetical protein